jgi:transmembrane sensor
MKNSETYLSDWLANTITDEQLKQIVSDDDYIAFQKIKTSLDTFDLSSQDSNGSFQSIQDKIQSKKRKSARVIPLWRFVSIAASLTILLSVCFYFSRETSIETDYGRTQDTVLADNSVVTLNAKSKLTYCNFFKYNRKLYLEGEAFFRVEKGSRFTVATPLGKVEVLGTKFTVSNSDDFLEVICYEGKVRVTLENDRVVDLTRGESFQLYNNESELRVDKTLKSPLWLADETSFKNVPFKIILEKITNQYGVEFTYPKSISNIVFSGTFTHDDLDIALKSVCIPLDLNYKKRSAMKIEISE